MEMTIDERIALAMAQDLCPSCDENCIMVRLSDEDHDLTKKYCTAGDNRPCEDIVYQYYKSLVEKGVKNLPNNNEFTFELLNNIPDDALTLRHPRRSKYADMFDAYLDGTNKVLKVSLINSSVAAGCATSLREYAKNKGVDIMCHSRNNVVWATKV